MLPVPGDDDDENELKEIVRIDIYLPNDFIIHKNPQFLMSIIIGKLLLHSMPGQK
jgi:hypothetical protein